MMAEGQKRQPLPGDGWGNHVCLAKDTHTIQELLEAVFSTRSVPWLYKESPADFDFDLSAPEDL
jgi:hypothetical protein